jgi:GNAT superfamily N-acetyltransferase
MSQTQIRLALPHDLPAVVILWEHLDAYHHRAGLAFPAVAGAGEAWRASFERTLGRFSFLWVADDTGQVLGFVLARLKRTPAYLGGLLVGEISDLYVEDRLRGQGVGGDLVAAAMARLEAENVHSVEVQIMEQNGQGKQFWLRQGFQPEVVQVRRMMVEKRLPS